MKKQKDILDELRDEAGHLYDLKVRLQPPAEDYFDRLPDRVWDKIGAQQDEEDGLGDYFAELPDKVLDRVAPLRGITRLRPIVLAVAAVCTLVLCSVFLFRTNDTTGAGLSTEQFVENLEEDEMMYLLSQYSSLTDLASLTSSTETEENSSELEEDLLLQLLDESDLLQELNM